ncbi:FtsB family cell division protein [Thiomicrospira sp.]|uniref:FtsB family cell division protein n=1 Tax=Thiomicrospira sp. TaxID=935 RepID=UPI002F94B2B4
MRVFLIILTVLLFLSLARLLSSNGGLGELLSLQSRLAEIETQVETRQNTNALLKQEVLDLQSGDTAIETIARQRLGMVAEGEVFVQLLELKPSNIVAPSPDQSATPVIENPQPINRIVTD